MIAGVVDLDRYPVDPIDSRLVEQCREALRREGATKLDGCVRPDAVERMVEEARALAALGEVLLGSRDLVARLATEPGTLAFFRGRYSMHRVPSVGGSTPG